MLARELKMLAGDSVDVIFARTCGDPEWRNDLDQVWHVPPEPPVLLARDGGVDTDPVAGLRIREPPAEA